MKKLVLFISLAFCIYTNAQVPTNGLVFRQDFTGNFNVTSATNATSNVNTATLGADEFNTPSNAGTFNLNQTIEYPLSTNPHLMAGTPLPEITVSTKLFLDSDWYNYQIGNPHYVTFLTIGNVYMRLLKNGDGTVQCGVYTANGFLGSSGTTSPELAVGWNTITFTYGPDPVTSANYRIRIYINGILMYSTPITPTNQPLVYNSATEKLILGKTAVTQNSFKGKLDRVLIYNRCLTAAEVLAIQYDKPTVTSIKAVNGSVTYALKANGSATTSLIRYGTSAASLTSSITGGTATGTTNTPASAVLTGLTNGTTYYYQIEATNASGTTLSPIKSFIAGLIAQYDFDDTVYDINNSNPFSSGNLNVADRNGLPNKAIGLQNATCGTTIPNLPYGNSPRTVSIWANIASLDPTDNNHLFGYGSPSTNNASGGSVGVMGSNVKHLGYANNHQVSATIAQNAWVHYVFVYTGTQSKIYVNGVLKGTQNYTWSTITNFDNFTIGSFMGENRFFGAIDDLKIYNFAISDAAVASLYNSNSLLSSALPTATSPQEFCGSATVANLTATGTDLKWYNVATGGTALASTTALTTGTYYVTQTQTGLSESARLSVSVTVTATPSAPITASQGYCNGATVANLISSGTTVRWYNVATGGTPLPTTTLLVTGNYYVSQVIGNCESARTLSSVTIATTPPPTAPANQSFCAGTTGVFLAATGIGLKWYTTATGGTLLDINLPLTAGNYYVSQTPNTNCESARTMVTVTLNPIPAAPTANSQSLCTGATVADLTASGTGLKWYNVATGGTVLASTTALANGNYYVSQTTSNCESARTMVAVTVNPIPSAPFSQTTQTFCGNGTVADLTATGTSLKWYNVATGGTPLTASTALTIGSYYVSQTTSNCESDRTMIFVNINPVPMAPASNSQSFCNSATVADLTASGTTLKWYSTATGGTVLPTTTALTSGNYYVSQTVSNCESARTTVAVTINTVAAPTGNTTQTFVTGATISSLVASGTAISWYSSESDALANANILATNSALTTNTTYYAMQTVNGCRSTSALAVTVTLTLSTESFATNFNFSIFPNPAKDTFTIDTENDIKSVEIYSLHGQKVLISTSKDVNVSSLSAGMYLVRIEDSNNAVSTQKLVIR